MWPLVKDTLLNIRHYRGDTSLLVPLVDVFSDG